MLIAADQRLFDRTKLTGKDTASPTVNGPVRTVEMILQVLPQPTNVVVVIGDSALERFWSTEIQRDLQPLTNGVSFAWLNQMPFSEMLKRCAVLPPRSAIFFPILCVDAAGVPHLEKRAMAKLHELRMLPFSVSGAPNWGGVSWEAD